MKKFLYAAFMWLVRLTWGLPSTLVGFVIFLFFCITSNPKEIHFVANTVVMELPHKPYESGWGLSSGLFIFSNSNSIWNQDHLFYHEFGHSWPQLLAFGPLHLFIVWIPSVIRFQWREHQYRKGNKNLPPYDSAWFERTATNWGLTWLLWGEEHGMWGK